MITLKVTITGKNGLEERQTLQHIESDLRELRRRGQLGEVRWETAEETVPLTLKLAAQRVVTALKAVGDFEDHGAEVDDLRRVLAGEYVCVPKESVP